MTVRRNSNADEPPNTLSLFGAMTTRTASVDVWLPKDHPMVQRIVGVYFERLNTHRPVFSQKDFERVLTDLYDGQTMSHDPGFVCSLYLILALGTLSELNHRATHSDVDNNADIHLGPAMAKKLMPLDWPAHDEFFERALAVKPDLRVTISSLQALILLHWYLYTEVFGFSASGYYFDFNHPSFSVRVELCGVSWVVWFVCPLSLGFTTTPPLK